MGERVYLIVVYTEIMLKSSKLTILHFTVMLIYNFKLTCCFNYFVFVGCYFNYLHLVAAIEFCSNYIENSTHVGLPQSCHECTPQGRRTRGFNVAAIDRQQVSQAHLYVLNNTSDVIPYIDAHK